MKANVIRVIFGILVIARVNESCDVGEYLDYESCKCRKRLVDKLVKEYNEIADEVKIVHKNENKCSSCML